MRRSWSVLALLAVVCGLVATCAHSSEQALREGILRDTPLGASMERVALYCQSSGWSCKRSEVAGYLDQKANKVVGVKSIRGDYDEKKGGVSMPSSISVFWGFDADGRLLDIWVWRTIDAP